MFGERGFDLCVDMRGALLLRLVKSTLPYRPISYQRNNLDRKVKVNHNLFSFFQRIQYSWFKFMKKILLIKNKVKNNHSDHLTAVSGVGLSPALATCETSQVLLAGVAGGFSWGSPVFAHLLIGPSHLS